MTNSARHALLQTHAGSQINWDGLALRYIASGFGDCMLACDIA